MWRIALVVVVVPAPDEPVMAIIGCFTDIEIRLRNDGY
ncbi:hypothetical protein AOR13_3672 [Alteromonas stellipolaris LMG 21856]|nr:hypothetical protein AOR13_3672 [Alteromonas stellipolaris LMG 21856]